MTQSAKDGVGSGERRRLSSKRELSMPESFKSQCMHRGPRYVGMRDLLDAMKIARRDEMASVKVNRQQRRLKSPRSTATCEVAGPFPA